MSLTRRLFVDVATASRLDLDADAIRYVEQRLEGAAASDRRVVTVILVAVVGMMLAGCVIGSGIVWLGESVGIGRGLAVAAVSIINPAIFCAIWIGVVPPIMRRVTRKALRECGYDICVRCGYVLTGLGDAPRCPECGKEDQPPLGSGD